MIRKVTHMFPHICVISNKSMCFPQSLTSSWRRGPRQQTLCRLPLEITRLTLRAHPVAPTKRLNRQRTASLPCRLFSQDLCFAPPQTISPVSFHPQRSNCAQLCCVLLSMDVLLCQYWARSPAFHF